MRTNITKQIILPTAFMLLAICLTSCIKNNNRNPEKVTVAKLKELITDDSNSYRMVYIYNSLCNSCEDQMKKYASYYLNGVNREVHHYLVSLQPNRWKFHSDTLNVFLEDKRIQLLVVDDSNRKYSIADENYIINIVSELLLDTTVTLYNGTPQSFFLSNCNKLLKSTFVIDNERFIVPCEVADVAGCRICDLDFDKMIEL